VLRRAAEAVVTLAGVSRVRHRHTPPESLHRDDVVVDFGAPAEHAFASAVDALCHVLSASGLAA
jgi:GntR family transcriptional regulator / MocR family aminotransferase